MQLYRATKKHKGVRAVKSKPKALRHIKVNTVLKIDETVYSRRNPCDTNIYMKDVKIYPSHEITFC